MKNRTFSTKTSTRGSVSGTLAYFFSVHRCTFFSLRLERRGSSCGCPAGCKSRRVVLFTFHGIQSGGSRPSFGRIWPEVCLVATPYNLVAWPVFHHCWPTMPGTEALIDCCLPSIKRADQAAPFKLEDSLETHKYGIIMTATPVHTWNLGHSQISNHKFSSSLYRTKINLSIISVHIDSWNKSIKE